MSETQLRRLKEILQDAEVIADGTVLDHIRAALSLCHSEVGDPDDVARKAWRYEGGGRR